MISTEAEKRVAMVMAYVALVEAEASFPDKKKVPGNAH